MKREQAIAEIRSVERRCRGPLAENIRSEVIQLLAKGDAETARKIDEANRRPCGYDFNEIVASGPWDGLEHDYECPECGSAGSYRAPWFQNIEG